MAQYEIQIPEDKEIGARIDDVDFDDEIGELELGLDEKAIDDGEVCERCSRETMGLEGVADENRKQEVGLDVVVDENNSREIDLETVTRFEVEQPPDGGFGWVQVGVLFVINAFTWGQTASYSVYLAYYLEADTFATATSRDYAFIGGLQFALSLIISPIVTTIVRKAGTQIPMLMGIFIQTIGFIVASFASKIWHLYLSQGVLLGVGLGFIFVPAIPILSQWFEKKRSLVMGIASAGSGVGGLLFSFGIQAIIQHISIAWSFRITALICVTMNLLAVSLIRNRNSTIKPPQIGFDTTLLVRYDVLLLLAWGFLSMLGYITLLYSLPSFAESIGLSASQAAAISAFLNLGTAVGRPMVGWVSDKLGRIQVAGALTAACGVMCFAIWIPASAYGVTILFAVVSGAVVGVFWMTVAPISVEVAGLQQVPSLLSLMWVTIFLPILFAEVIALKLRRASSSHEYLYAQIFAGLSLVLASLCLLELWRVKARGR